MTATLTTQALELVKLDALVPHPHNRKRFDAAQLQELAASLAAKGQLTPAIVRPFTENDGTYQILAGERRWRAAQQAGLPGLLCLVRNLDDQEALEVLAIENNQREDVHPLEEAELFAELLRYKGYTVATIAEKLHRSKSYVAERLRLLRLTKPARALVLDGSIPYRHAVLLATLTPEHQAKALDGLGDAGLTDGLFRHEDTLFGDGKMTCTVVSEAEFRDWIRATVRFDPKGAAAAELFPETAAVVAEAEAARRKVLWLTDGWEVDEKLIKGQDPKAKILTHQDWKRADGKGGSKRCEHAELGVVVAGRLQGQAFDVCAARQDCSIHWKDEQKAAAARAAERKAPTGPAAAPSQNSWAAEQAKREAEQARWKKALPALRKAFLEKLKTAPLPVLTDFLVKRVKPYGYKPEALKAKASADDVLRYLVLLVVDGEDLCRTYGIHEQVPAVLKPFGIDAKKIVDEVAPKPKPAAAAAPAKKLAGDVRRAKKAGKKK